MTSLYEIFGYNPELDIIKDEIDKWLKPRTSTNNKEDKLV